MSVGLPFSRFSSCFFVFLLVMALLHLCLSDTNASAMLCMDGERQALLQFKNGLIDRAGRLASWVQEENSDCCTWAGIACDNITGHVYKIHLPDNFVSYGSEVSVTYEERMKRKLRGDLSPSLLNLKQLKHLDLSNNDFGGKQIPRFMGSLKNLRYLNISCSGFGGTIPPQLGNLSELRILGLGSFYETYFDGRNQFNMMNIEWLSGLRFLHHLDMSGLNVSQAINWLQVINNLPSLVELHLCNCQLMNMHQHVARSNLTSLSLLDLSGNQFYLMPRWIFSITNLVSLDLSGCRLNGLVPSSSEGFHNMSSLKLLYMSRNNFKNSTTTKLSFCYRNFGGKTVTNRYLPPICHWNYGHISLRSSWSIVTVLPPLVILLLKLVTA